MMVRTQWVVNTEHLSLHLAKGFNSNLASVAVPFMLEDRIQTSITL